MASAPSHAIAAFGLGILFGPEKVPRKALLIGMVCSVVPDADVIGFRFGVRYGDALGHRGFSHSLVFAGVLSALLVAMGWRSSAPSRRWLWLYLFLATASHGMLDALTNGGLGVAFFAPFTNERYFFPLRPIVVSPIGVDRFFSERGLRVLRSEMVWIWLPVALTVAVALLARKRPRPSQ